ncbi:MULTISPECIES: hypothetical protein [unclassified Leptospira]|uniref:hypothetical protein n=1 Tax=unclassified Leptospira TaxID=2633828 RepID=UPI0002BEF1F6|nr:MULTISPECIES: hypothetical protein [unclassified Leptospira]EMK00547.1 hypothetical protein LEP1GSC192_2333 [Leptospira sp. B5-022]MCR1793076.1 hypothetical protein [Leptospira sp. id769339]
MKSKILNPVLILFILSIISAISIFIFVATYSSPINRSQTSATNTEIGGLIWLVVTILILYNAGLASFRNLFLEKFSETRESLGTAKGLFFSVVSLILFLIGSKLGSLFKAEISSSELLMIFPIVFVATWENFLTKTIALKFRSVYLILTTVFQIIVYISFMLSFLTIASLDGFD